MSIYNVKSGDTLGKIAQQNNVSVDELAKLNPEIQDINKISIGQTIKLPTKKEETPTTKSIESEKALLASIQEEKKVTTELEAKEQVSKEVSKRLQSLESWTDDDWKDKDKITSLSSVLGQLGGAESTREEQIKNLYEKVQTRKKIKKELGRYADVSEMPENIIKQANAAGLKPEEHTNFWLGALKGFGQTVNSFASKAGTAMENVGMANPQGIYGGAGMAAQRRMQEEALAKEEARYKEQKEYQAGRDAIADEHNKSLLTLKENAQQFAERQFEWSKGITGLNAQMTIAAKHTELFSKILNNNELLMSFTDKNGLIDFDKINKTVDGMMETSGYNKYSDLMEFHTGVGDMRTFMQNNVPVLVNNKGEVYDTEVLNPHQKEVFDIGQEINNLTKKLESGVSAQEQVAVKKELKVLEKRLNKEMFKEAKAIVKTSETAEDMRSSLEELGFKGNWAQKEWLNNKEMQKMLMEELQEKRDKGLLYGTFISPFEDLWNEGKRLFNLAGKPKSAIAEAAINMISQDEEFAPFKSMIKGWDAEERNSFFDVLETIGWEPESMAGKATKRVAGEIGDVVIDPRWWLAGILSGGAASGGFKALKAHKNYKLANFMMTAFRVYTRTQGKNLKTQKLLGVGKPQSFVLPGKPGKFSLKHGDNVPGGTMTPGGQGTSGQGVPLSRLPGAGGGSSPAISTKQPPATTTKITKVNPEELKKFHDSVTGKPIHFKSEGDALQTLEPMFRNKGGIQPEKIKVLGGHKSKSFRDTINNSIDDMKRGKPPANKSEEHLFNAYKKLYEKYFGYKLDIKGS